MNRGFHWNILDLKDKQILDEDKNPLLAENVVMGCLITPLQDDDGPKKAKKFKLAQRINATPESVELSAEEITLIKDVVGKLGHPIVVGRIFEFLEEDPK